MTFKFHRDKIRRLRASLGMSQQEFAEKIDLKRQHVCAYEQGVMMPQVRTIVKMLNVFNLPGDYFFTSSNYHKNNQGGVHVPPETH